MDITEDYVSFETAKLLKEKGFNVECEHYHTETEVVYAIGASDWNDPIYGGMLSAPTLQMAMKWLREVYNYNIEVDALGRKDNKTLEWRSFVYYLINQTQCYYKGNFTSYNEACEAAIKYCLENLI